MAFFSFVRIFGVLWYLADYPGITLLPQVEVIALMALWYLDCWVKVETLTPYKLKRSLLLTLGVMIFSLIAVSTLPAFEIFVFMVLFDTALQITIGVWSNRKSRDIDVVVGRVILYIFLINIYTLFMMLGRGYPVTARMDALWQIVAIFDYRAFLILILCLKVVYLMQNTQKKLETDKQQTARWPLGGCWGWFDKEVKLSRRIGRFIMAPIRKLTKYDV